MPNSSQAEMPVSAAENNAVPSPASTGGEQSVIRAYLMDLWSFIPYYLGHLCAGLREQSVDATLGSARYHLDRDYFRKAALTPDPVLLDAGGRLQSHLWRRVIKSCEYIANLAALALRFLISKPDILHVQYLPFLEHGFSFEIWFLRWVRRLGVGVVYTVHNLTRQDAPGRNKPVYRKAYHLADALICHGEEARTRLIQDFGVPAARICVIPHGPLFDSRPRMSPEEARASLGLPITGPMVLCQGVISEYKGIPFLLDAWKQFIESGGQGRLVIAGTGDARILTAIQDKVSADRLESSVDLWLRFVPVEQLPLLYQAADILVYPYKTGTTSGALLTGLNYGKAIVATTLPFFREYLHDGDTAILVEYGDVGALATSLQVLVQHPEERSRLSAALQSRAAQAVSWREIAKATRDCYTTVLNGRRPLVSEDLDAVDSAAAARSRELIRSGRGPD